MTKLEKLPLEQLKIGGYQGVGQSWYEHDLSALAPHTAKRYAPKRVCFDVRLSRIKSTVQEGGYHPALVIEGESGYQPTTLDIGADMVTCEHNVKRANEALGLTEEDVNTIRASSMR